MAAIRTVAQRLGNTPAVCKSCYVHPRVIDAYLQGTMLDAMRRRTAEAMADVKHLRPEEAAVLVRATAPAGRRPSGVSRREVIQSPAPVWGRWSRFARGGSRPLALDRPLGRESWPACL